MPTSITGNSISIGSGGVSGVWNSTNNTFKSGSRGNVNSPIVHAFMSDSSQTISDATWTKNVWLGDETIDTDDAFSSSTFTVPAGRDGLYHISTGVNFYSDGNNMRNSQLAIYKNGSKVVGSYNIVMSGDQDLRHFQAFAHTILDLSAGDYIEQYFYMDTTSGVRYISRDGSGVRGNYILIHKL
tara:strand:- start:446 stop:997 length:552 start_codon:yes stop_codon:yes gene_type:complete